MSLIKNLRSSWDKVYHDSARKIDDQKERSREKLLAQMGAASDLGEKILKYGISEVFSTLKVTAYHPMGWSWQYFKKQVDSRLKQAPESLDLQLSCPLLMVHGISHNSTAFYKLQKKASERGFRNISTIEMWTTLRNLTEMSLELEEKTHALFQAHQKIHPKGKVRIVAHSLGGMILRAALTRPHIQQWIDRVVFLGVPHQGNVFYRLPFLKSLQDLHPNSALMKQIKSQPLPGGIEYWNLRGQIDLVTPKNDTYLPTTPNLFFENVGHAGLLADQRVIETVLNIFQEDFPK